MSHSTITSLVPLTTTFTPPPACAPTGFILVSPLSNGAVSYYFPNQAEAQTSGYLTIQAECFPPGYSYAATFSPAPGICPSGWTIASSSSYAASSTGMDVMTYAICCPSGWSEFVMAPLASLWLLDPGYVCHTLLESGYTYTGLIGFVESTYTGLMGLVDSSVSVEQTSLLLQGTIDGYASGILLQWQSTDIITSTSPTRTLPSSPTQTSPVTIVPSSLVSHQLTLGAQIGIGIAVPVFTLLCILLLCHMKRTVWKRSNQKKDDGPSNMPNPELSGESAPIDELSGGMIAELSTDLSAAPVELPVTSLRPKPVPRSTIGLRADLVRDH